MERGKYSIVGKKNWKTYDFVTVLAYARVGLS